MAALLAALALALTTVALQRTDGHYEPWALALVLAAFACCVAGLFGRVRTRADRWAHRALPVLLWLGVAAELFTLQTTRPGLYLRDGVSMAPYGLALNGAWLVLLSFPWRTPSLARARVPICLGLFVLLGVWMIHASPKPFIDVWYFEQRAADSLTRGINPYSIDYPYIYGNNPDYTSALLVRGNRILAYPYPPLSLLLTLPGYLAGGDVRYSLLLALAATAAFLVAMGRRLGAKPGDPVELVAMALLFHPRGLFLIEQAWSDPFLALAAAVCVWTLASAAPRAPWLSLAFLLAAKQYGLLLLPALWRTGRLRARDVTIAVAAAAAVTLPFFVWDAAGLWRGMVVFQIYQPFRVDALSLLSLVNARLGVRLPSAIGFLGAAAMVLVLWRKRLSLGRATLGGAATFLAFFFLNKQAFFNYYWFAQVLLALATVALFVEQREPPREA